MRLYEPGDREALLSLWETTFGRSPGRWFDWKFLENPFFDDVPICVVSHDGRVVGARPSFAFPLSVGGNRLLALMPEGAMVHPDHRRRGLYTRLVEFQYGHFADREPAALVGFPNDVAKGALYKLDHLIPLSVSVDTTFPMYYRVENPAAIVPTEGGRAVRGLGRFASPLLRGYLGVRDRLADASEFTVDRHRTVPAVQLASFASDHASSTVHAARDETFYRWRFSNPRYETEAYVARRGDSLVASVVAETAVEDGVTVTYVSDVQPTTVEGRSADALSSAFARLVADHDDTDLFAVAGDRVPEPLLAAHGFHPNTRPPLSLATSPDNFVARPLTTETLSEWTEYGVELSDPRSWAFSFCEHNVG